ncbi:MAG: hypothetical protein IPK44_01360 [Candidatus Accumulibacter sp.]|uniref:hypothetical protein n=1 Tax=Accumulibacter sp. TaxID=2053492 RepID=UPI0025887DDF|nr:hypothetical protein [Accumulibacter sp.]MBK8113247.1 hypothetical protein [Accumulibacter sp.]
MARKSGGWGYRVSRCGRCERPGAMFSPYSQQTVCPQCLAFERAAANLQAAVREQAELDAMEAEYADERETMRSLRQGAVQ